MGTRGSLPGGKVDRHEADHSPPSSTEIKNDWSYDSTPPYTSMECIGATLPFTLLY